MQTWGSDDLAYAPQEKLLEMADPYERQVILVAKVDGEIVGTVDIALPLADNLDLAEFTLDILPEFQRQGVGRQLLEAAEHFARDEGRHTILIDTNHPGASLTRPRPNSWCPARRRASSRWAAGRWSSPATPATPCSTSSSSAPARCRWTPSSSRSSRPRPRKPTTAATACTTGPTGARTSGWRPWPRWKTRPARTTCPGPTTQEMVFDGGILREAEDVTIAQGRRTVVTAVEHIASGTLVGLTTISVLALRPDVVFQDDTVVLQEHRGNKLGLLIKVANMERLTRAVPGCPGPLHLERPGKPVPAQGQPAARIHHGGRDGDLAEGTPGLRPAAVS